MVILFEAQTLLTKSPRSTSLFGESGRKGPSGVNIFPEKCCTYVPILSSRSWCLRALVIGSLRERKQAMLSKQTGSVLRKDRLHVDYKRGGLLLHQAPFLSQPTRTMLVCPPLADRAHPGAGVRDASGDGRRPAERSPARRRPDCRRGQHSMSRPGRAPPRGTQGRSRSTKDEA